MRAARRDPGGRLGRRVARRATIRSTPRPGESSAGPAGAGSPRSRRRSATVAACRWRWGTPGRARGAPSAGEPAVRRPRAGPSGCTPARCGPSSTRSSTTGGDRSHGLSRTACGTRAATGCTNADIAVPVPLHAFRRWRRGFNQAADLAAHLGIPVVHALRRTRHTGRQVELSRAARLEALGGAFALARRGSRRAAAAAVRGRSVVLVDDVITTGATVDACAAVLRNAGAQQVRALSAALAVAARSQPPSPQRPPPAPVRRRCAPSPAGRPDGDSSPAPA